MASRVPAGRKHQRWAGPLFDGHICSLGYEIVDWIQTYECHGPGDLQGEPIELDDEWFDFLIEAYRLDPQTGQRFYTEAVLSRPKGRAKSELAGFIGVVEAFAPSRHDGWDANGQPVARPVRSPLLKCLATEESQAGNTFQNIAYITAEWGPDVHPEIYGGVKGVRQYQKASSISLPRGGEILACTSGAASKDGGKETWVCADETHLYVLPELKSMFATVQRNCGKRKIAQPWLLQTTTMYRLGQQSTAEETLTQWENGELGDRVLVDHREASGKVNSETLKDPEYTKRQLIEVYGPAAEWHDMDRKYLDMRDPRKCRDDAEAARYYLNRGIPASDGWIDHDVIKRQRRLELVEPGTSIAMGFDGSINDDSTVLIGSRMTDGFKFPIGIWEKPSGSAGRNWEVDRPAVLAAIREAFGQYDVVRAYFDPHEWRTDIGDLAGEFGRERVVEFRTDRDLQMSAALNRLHTDMVNGVEFHSGDKRYMQHFKNAYAALRGKLTLVRKEHDKSPRKIDCVVGSALAGEARADAIAAGWTPPKPKPRMIVRR